MSTIILDIETESLTPSNIWCIYTLDIETGEEQTYLNPTSIPEEKERFNKTCTDSHRYVLHNGIGFDVPVLRKLCGWSVRNDRITDTLVVSRLKDYGIEDGHSLAAWGQRLGFPKTYFKKFDTLSQEMIDYCKQDVRVTHRLYTKLLPFINDKTQATALQVEHDIQWLCEEMTDNGFYFNKTEAETILAEITERKNILETGFQKDFPPKLEPVHSVTYRTTKDGKEFASVTKAKEKYMIHTVKDGMLLCFDYVPFNPGSPQQRIDRLWEAGWQPTDKTKGYLDYERKQQRY